MEGDDCGFHYGGRNCGTEDRLGWEGEGVDASEKQLGRDGLCGYISRNYSFGF